MFECCINNTHLFLSFVLAVQIGLRMHFWRNKLWRLWRGLYATRAKPLSFPAIKDLAPPKRRLSRLHSDNRLFGVPAGKLSKSPTAKSRPRLSRPTVQWEMAKSLILNRSKRQGLGSGSTACVLNVIIRACFFLFRCLKLYSTDARF
jgi:hypothetical protein